MKRKMQLKEKLRLMRVRKVKNQQRPSFARFHSWRYKKLEKSGWRKQRGIDNKTRRKTKTGVKSPEPGYRGPKKIRNLHPSGLEDILVIHLSDFEELNSKFHGIRISSRLGVRKRMAILEYAREKGFKVLNANLSKDDILDMSPIDDDDVDEEIKDTSSSEEVSLSKKDQIKQIKDKASNETSADEISDGDNS